MIPVRLAVCPTVPYTERDPVTGRPIPTEWGVFRTDSGAKVGVLWLYPRTRTWLAYSHSGGARLDGNRSTPELAAATAGWHLTTDVG